MCCSPTRFGGILSAAGTLAVFAIVVEAKDEKAAGFYRDFGFSPFRAVHCVCSCRRRLPWRPLKKPASEFDERQSESGGW